MSMLKYDQTEFGSDGNCVQACIATLLGAPKLEDVPNFLWSSESKTSRRSSFEFWEAIDDYLTEKGLVRLMMGNNYYPECHYLVSGKTERGSYHMVVMFENKLVHDPHPSRAGLIQRDITHLIIPINLAVYKGFYNGK